MNYSDLRAIYALKKATARHIRRPAAVLRLKYENLASGERDASAAVISNGVPLAACVCMYILHLIGTARKEIGNATDSRERGPADNTSALNHHAIAFHDSAERIRELRLIIRLRSRFNKSTTVTTVITTNSLPSSQSYYGRWSYVTENVGAC